jgi:transcriptional regulator of arginine metabolism
MTKQTRLHTVKEIVSSRVIGNQDELRRELKKRGCDVTQATLSRDMKELGLIWNGSADGGRYALPPAGEMRALRPLVTAEVLSIESNETLIVVRTLPGCANTVGEYIDVLKHPAIIGTVAGDNTLLVIPRSQRKTATVMQFLQHKLIEEQE